MDFRTSRLKGPLGWSLLSGLALFFALVAWLRYHGTYIGPDALYQELLAESLGRDPFVISLKREFSYPYSIVHADFLFGPLIPVFEALLSAVGVESWQRSSWLAAFFAAALTPAWAWALAPKLDSSQSRNAAGWATVLLLAQANNQLWLELAQGGAAPIAAALFALLAYGAAARGNAAACGALTGVAALAQWESLALIPALGWALGRDRRRFIRFGLAFVATTSPWWLRSMILTGQPWHNPAIPPYLLGATGQERWIPITDSALTLEPISGEALYVGFEQFLRARWRQLALPWTGPFLNELTLLGPALFLAFVYGARRPLGRGLVGVLWGSLLLLLLVTATQADAFQRSHFLTLDVLLAAWIGLLAVDVSPKIRFVARGLVALVVLVNWTPLQEALVTRRPGVSLVEGGAPAVAAALLELNPGGSPVMGTHDQVHAIAYLNRERPAPLVVLPSNWPEFGLLDQFVARFSVTWCLQDPSKLGAIFKRHRMDEARASNGVVLWRLTPLP